MGHVRRLMVGGTTRTRGGARSHRRRQSAVRDRRPLHSDHPPSNVTHPFGEISFVDFLDGAGLATVNVYFLSPPKGITKKNLALYELPSYPLLTATDGGAAVPKCVSVNGTLQIPPNSHFLS